jgi:hypothetical protein
MDLHLVSGDFFYEDVVSKDQRWLFKYFGTPQQRQFLAYYSQFGELRERGPVRFYHNFIDHTGVCCTKRAVQKWVKKLRHLLSLSQEAAERFDLEMLEKVKSGKYRFSHDQKTKVDPGIGPTM